MIEKIKKLRVQIDGLAQLTKELKPLNPIAIDLAYIPDGYTIEKFIEIYKTTEFFNKKENSDKAIINVPNQYKEIENSYNSLLLAKAWLGKLLGELGAENPYKSGYKTKEDIEPTADVAEAKAGMTEPFNKVKPSSKIDTWELNGISMFNYDSMNHIEKVDWLRTEIQKIIDTSPDFSNDFSEFTLENIVAEQTLVYKYLTEAKFWLGFELQRIKENK